MYGYIERVMGVGNEYTSFDKEKMKVTCITALMFIFLIIFILFVTLDITGCIMTDKMVKEVSLRSGNEPLDKGYVIDYISTTGEYYSGKIGEHKIVVKVGDMLFEKISLIDTEYTVVFVSIDGSYLPIYVLDVGFFDYVTNDMKKSFNKQLHVHANKIKNTDSMEKERIAEKMKDVQSSYLMNSK